MPSSVDASDVIGLVADGAQLVEVLPPAAYLEEHLPGANNILLKTLTVTLARDQLDLRRAVIVYCSDALRHEPAGRVAARTTRLPRLRLHSGQLDWIAHRLPTEGERRGPPRVRDAVLATVPTSRTD